jgi:single-stranded-DNA-specific exonuclease
VTDHHEVTGPLPDAAAVVDPRRPDCAYPDKRLAGVGVAYKVAQALLRELQPADADRISASMLDLVTIGTIADVVPLVGENRTLVSRGLPALSASERPGIRALLAISGRRQDSLGERDVSHRLAPRINATGRLSDAIISLDLLMDDGQRAEALAQQLESLNAERQTLMEQSVVRARRVLASMPERAFVALRDDECLPGVAGLVAARLTEELVRPVAVVVPLGDQLRGSVRTCTDFDVARALASCSDLLLSHGGHARAGGFSVRLELLDELTLRLSALAEQSEGQLGAGRRLRIDAELRLRHLHWDNYQAIRRLAPFGHGNPEPVFLTRGLRVTRARVVGRSDPAHLRLTLADSTRSIGAIAFRRGADAGNLPEIVDIAYQFARDEYGGPTALEARIVDLQASA